MNELNDGENGAVGSGRPRVLMSAFACEPGRGSEQEVGWRWALEMSQWFDVTVLTQTRNRPGIERELKKGLPADRSLHFEYFQLAEPIYRMKSRFDPLTWPYYAIWQWVMLRAAGRLHKESPFDLAHHVTFVSFRIPIWLKKLDIPVVFGPVGGADKAPFNLLGRGFGFGIKCKEILRNAMTDIGAGVLRVFPPLTQRQGYCLAATPSMAEIFERLKFPNEVFPAIGIDLAPPQEAVSAASGRIRFLFVGRFHPLKGTHLLLEAYARAGITGAQLTLIGGGADESRLLQLAKQLGIAEQLTWTGKLPREELAKFYQNHDVLVAPSLYESGGLVALEAMAQSMPAIVLDVGGHSVSVIDDCGVKVSPEGKVDQVIDRLADAMCAYADTPEKIAADGRRAYVRVANEYDWSHKAQRIKNIYAQVLKTDEGSR
jgi:glycosyltransferase involved in cell wall biosynthesis